MKTESEYEWMNTAMQRAQACRNGAGSFDAFLVLKLALELEVAKKRIAELESK